MLVAPFFGHDGVPQDVRDLAVHRASVEITQPHTFGCKDGHIAVGQEKHVAGVMQDGGNVGSHEIFAVA